jgi:hypothetical protein
VKDLGGNHGIRLAAHVPTSEKFSREVKLSRALILISILLHPAMFILSSRNERLAECLDLEIVYPEMFLEWIGIRHPIPTVCSLLIVIAGMIWFIVFSWRRGVYRWAFVNLAMALLPLILAVALRVAFFPF